MPVTVAVKMWVYWDPLLKNNDPGDWLESWVGEVFPQAITREGEETLKSKLGKSKQGSLVSKWDNINWCKKTLVSIVTLCWLIKLHKKLWKGTMSYVIWLKGSFTIDFILKRSSNRSLWWPSLKNQRLTRRLERLSSWTSIYRPGFEQWKKGGCLGYIGRLYWGWCYPVTLGL